MWICARPSFERELVNTLHFSKREASQITREAKKEYKKIIKTLPVFEKGDAFEPNTVNCALFSAFLLHMLKKPEVDVMTEYYSKAMMTAPVRFYYRQMGKKKFTTGDIKQQRKTAALKAADRNPYSWNMDYLPYEDGSGYECRFERCGICTLMKELGVFEYTPAMCHLDYDMNDAGGTSRFMRQYTLASGGPYCDCGYKRL